MSFDSIENEGKIINLQIVPFVQNIMRTFNKCSIAGKCLILVELLTIVDVLIHMLDGINSDGIKELLKEYENIMNVFINDNGE